MPETTKPIRFGGLREKVKAGIFSAKDVLAFARKNHASARFIGWLRRFDLETHKKRAEENRKITEKKVNTK